MSGEESELNIRINGDHFEGFIERLESHEKFKILDAYSSLENPREVYLVLMGLEDPSSDIGFQIDLLDENGEERDLFDLISEEDPEEFLGELDLYRYTLEIPETVSIMIGSLSSKSSS